MALGAIARGAAPKAMALHRAIGEIVRFTHDDMGFQGCSGRNAANLHVILTPAAQLRACSGRDRAGCRRRLWRAMLRRGSVTMHCQIGEIVHSVHYDMVLHGFSWSEYSEHPLSS
jgi:hypothetical protein